MREDKIGQRLKVDFNNDFHNTESTGIGKITGIFEQQDNAGNTEKTYRIYFSEGTLKKVERELCGMSDCTCGGTGRGTYRVRVTGDKLDRDEISYFIRINSPVS